MKRLRQLILLIVAALVTLVTGCDSTPGYDGRLTAADALMHDDPDSALAIVEAVSPDSLSTEGDRAYRALLLTQARYRCYVTASNDSDINRALAYYRAHSREREKLTRAYIYKGAVMEELGHPDSAMLYYKHAEANADEYDYANLGQINTRIASLFRYYYADKQTCCNKYERALKYYRLTGNKQMQQNCLLNMASCVSITKNGNPRGLLDQALSLAIELNDSSKIADCKEFLSRLLSLHDSTRHEAKRIALSTLKDYNNYINNNLLLTIADIYTKENLLDSAKYYLGQVHEEAEPNAIHQIKSTKFSILSVIASKEGKIFDSKRFADSVSMINDLIVNNPQKHKLQRIEMSKNQSYIAKDKNTIKNLKWWVLLLALFIVFTLGLIVRAGAKEIKLRAIINEVVKNAHTEKVDKHEELLEMISAKEIVIEKFVKNMVAFMQMVIESSEKDNRITIRKKVKEGIDMTTNEEFWNELRAYLDNHYNQIITKIAQNPKMSEKDLRFIELSCCGFGYIEIAFTMNYRPEYVSQKRKAIAKKLNLPSGTSLQSHLSSLMNLQ